MYRTIYALSLDQLVDNLTDYCRDPELEGAEWLSAITDAFLGTPTVWPMSDELFEVLLGFAGMRLDTPAGVHAAVAISRYLEGTGICPIVCTHDEDDPSPRCVQVRNDELRELSDQGAEFTGTHDLQHWQRTRALVAAAHARSIEVLEEGYDDAA